MMSLPASWPQVHSFRVAMGRILCSLKAFVPADEQWLVPALLKDFRLSMDRMAEVLRRREALMVAVYGDASSTHHCSSEASCHWARGSSVHRG